MESGLIVEAASQRQVDETVNKDIHDTFRWLDDHDDLDLRLGFDQYPSIARDDGIASGQTDKRRRYFRRHLSVSKFSLGARIPTALGRPGAKDAEDIEKAAAAPSNPASTSCGHARRRSRALSLIAPSRPPASEPSVAVDHAASHYQDPDARKKLRLYLASPHKFDEAVEFGFPSNDEALGCKTRIHGGEDSESKESHHCSTFLQDGASSVYSEESLADPETPKTPDVACKAMPIRPTRVSQDQSQSSASSREMTLRVTLTRPDLRAGDDEIYGWQKAPLTIVGRKSQTRDDGMVVAPLSYSIEGNPKESIERQFAAFDEEAVANDGGVVKRIWNRVRRT
ncbi:hypothetical protein CDD81_2289 [Ophiocordyceps australis]|uniref:Uncharacterized protein n=1 Tax=Ophiocordyceps australis TaxID=1399860 RepID=A0A2C5XB31_9HYPO|nr:hypothetical protein CDD81_2289 [Ophiocordyceps australis]